MTGIAPSVGCRVLCLCPSQGSSKMCRADLPTPHSEVLIPLSTPIHHGVRIPPSAMLVHAACNHHLCPIPVGIPQPPGPFHAKLPPPPSAGRPPPVPSCLPRGVSHATRTKPVCARSASLCNPSHLLTAAGNPTAASIPQGPAVPVMGLGPLL